MHDPSEHERDGPGATGELRPADYSAEPRPGHLGDRTRLRLAAAGIALTLAALAAAWALTVGLAPRPDIVVVGRPELLDRPAPGFELPSLDGGRRVALADYRGRPVIVHFWASWCIPCREEFPLLAAARDRYADEGLEVLGIVHDDGPEAARRFAAAYGAAWPLLLDAHETAWNAYGGVLLPITFYVDREGVVRAASYGPPPSGVLDEQIEKIL